MPTYHKNRRVASKKEETQDQRALRILKFNVDGLHDLLFDPKPHLSRWRRKVTIFQDGIQIGLSAYRTAQHLGLIKQYEGSLTWDKERPSTGCQA